MIWVGSIKYGNFPFVFHFEPTVLQYLYRLIELETIRNIFYWFPIYYCNPFSEKRWYLP